MAQPPTVEEMLAHPASGPSAELLSIEVVGNYALLPVWADGHRYGIYTWDYLRRLCPCGEHGES